MPKVKKVVKQEKVTKTKAVVDLRAEIVKQAKLLATGKITTAFPLVEAAKELIVLEGDESKVKASEF